MVPRRHVGLQIKVLHGLQDAGCTPFSCKKDVGLVAGVVCMPLQQFLLRISNLTEKRTQVRFRKTKNTEDKTELYMDCNIF
jgi:hypothetical protein